MNSNIKALTQEVYEIIVNINYAYRDGKIDFQTRDELIAWKLNETADKLGMLTLEEAYEALK